MELFYKVPKSTAQTFSFFFSFLFFFFCSQKCGLKKEILPQNCWINQGYELMGIIKDLSINLISFFSGPL
jgi:hypothetical protein